MSLDLRILASGSSGNCSVVRTARGCILVDAGIGPRVAARRLDGSGITLADVSAVVLTHLDSDHFCTPFLTVLSRRGVKVFVARSRTAEVLYRCPGAQAVVRPFEADEPFEPLPGVAFSPIHLAHDAHGSHGFVIHHAGRRIGYATDLGLVPDHLIERFEQLDILALESNYDRQMQHESHRPIFLKRRIMGGTGHLSNDQALEAIRTIFARAQAQSHGLPAHVVLLHRSRQCNCPRRLAALFAADPHIAARLTLAHPFESTGWLTTDPRPPLVGEQLPLTYTAAMPA